MCRYHAYQRDIISHTGLRICKSSCTSCADVLLKYRGNKLIKLFVKFNKNVDNKMCNERGSSNYGNKKQRIANN